VRLGTAWQAAQGLLAELRRIAPESETSTAGSLRRMRETIGDVDLLCATNRPVEVLAAFVALPMAEQVLAHGDTKASIRVAGALPRLVELADMRGALHCHTTASDGHLSIEQLAQTALERGYEYAAVTDHSPSAAYAGGLSPERLLAHVAAVRAFNAKQSRIR